MRAPAWAHLLLLAAGHYYPTSSNSYLTVVTIETGRVTNLERNRKTD